MHFCSLLFGRGWTKCCRRACIYIFTELHMCEYAHTGVHLVQGNLLISVSPESQIGLGLSYMGQKAQSMVKAIRFWGDLWISITSTSFICVCIRGSKGEHEQQALSTACIHTTKLCSCTPSPLSPTLSSSELWTQQPYLTLLCCQWELSISGFILSRGQARAVGLKPSRFSKR